MASADIKVAIIGAGISGLAISHHLEHRDAVIFESTGQYSGHIHSEVVDGFTWDDGPHVSFSANQYVRDYLADMVDQEYEVLNPIVSNYFRGHWIGHPAQVNLFEVPEPLRTQCLQSFLDSREDTREPANYQEWLEVAFGPVFANTFPAAYTRKYWTVDPSLLATEWVGNRVLKPSVEQVTSGSLGAILDRTIHYTAGKETRYPTRGGFMSYVHKMAKGADIRLNTRVASVDFGKRELRTADGTVHRYEHLVSTMPLRQLIANSVDAPHSVREAALALTATTFLRIDVAVNHPAVRPENWLYVYDEDKVSTRISVTEKFAESNAPRDCTGIQVEVYGSEYRAVPTDFEQTKQQVIDELLEMGMIEGREHLRYVNCKYVPQGNPIFDHQRSAAMAEIQAFLDQHGVQLVGRYAEHRYLMTDACVISARRAVQRIRGGDDGSHDGTDVFISPAG